MKTLTKTIPLAASFFFIILFIYAAASKMLDFENFQVQLAQSPLLSAYAGFVSYGVIILELAIVGLLCCHASRLLGLYASFAIMVAFTVYIFLILNYSDFVPCSCGGILEKMGWTEHLIFNIACVLLAGLATILAYHFPAKLSVLDHSEEDYMKNYWQRRKDRRMIAYKMMALLVLSAGSMVALFLSSEYIMKKENNFTRRYLKHSITELKTIKLNSNYYYFAGYQNNNIFLGNREKPQLILNIDSTLSKLQHVYANIETDHNYRNLQLKVVPPFYFIYDGTIPVIFRGKLDDTSTNKISHNDAYFNDLIIIDSSNFIIRTQNIANRHLMLGILHTNNHATVKMVPNILTKQKDGFFDVDGILGIDYIEQKIVYNYFYRNEIIVMERDLKNPKIINTIDTTTIAKVSPVKLSSGKYKMNAPPYKVNNKMYAYHKQVFVNSNLKGKHEAGKSWKNSDVLDIYNTVSNEYIGSIKIYKSNKKSFNDFIITEDFLYVLHENKLTQFKLLNRIKKNRSTEQPKTVK